MALAMEVLHKAPGPGKDQVADEQREPGNTIWSGLWFGNEIAQLWVRNLSSVDLIFLSGKWDSSMSLCYQDDFTK